MRFNMRGSDLLTILHADSDAASREFVTNWLRMNARSYLLTCAVSGTDAITRVTKNPYDLYLFDYCLSDMTAPKLCERVRAIDPKSPVIICSPFDREIDRRMAMAAGATEFILKPDGFGSLADLINSLATKRFNRNRDRHHYPRRRAAAII